MSKLIPPVSGIACLVWVTLWSWWLSKEHSPNDLSNEGTLVSAITITDGDQQFTSKEVFSFHLSDATLVLPLSSIELIKSLANHLHDQPERMLLLSGKYIDGERNRSPYPNLGLARAKAIKDLLVEYGANPEQINLESKIIGLHYLVEDRLLGGVDLHFTTKEKAVGDDSLEMANSDEVTSENPPKKVPAGKPQAILFKYDKEIFTLAKKNRSVLDSLRRLVRNKPEHRLILSGYSSKDEEKAVSGNLAERRSLAVRRYLVDTGVRRKNIIIESHPGAAHGEDQQRVEITVIE